jgi:outer membrane protein OmpA-like peptidoglycan-associated protein
MLWTMWLAVAAAQSVSGGESPAMDAQLLRPTVDAQGMLITDLARRAVDREPSLRLLGHYTSEPLVYYRDDGEREALVASVTQADLLAGVGLGRARLGLAVPLYLLSTGVEGNESGLGDLGIDGRVTLLDPGEVPVALGLQGRIELPTSTMSASLGDPTVGWSVAAVGDVGIGDRVLLAANVGLQGGPASSLENLQVDDFVVFRGGPHVLLAPDPEIGASLELAARGSLSAAGDPAAATSVEWLVGGHGRVGDSPAVLRLGAGTGLSGGVGVPDYRVLLGVGWEPPADDDRDDDGIADRDDACPAEPEDVDGYEDVDGCPDPDNDGDMVVDVVDRCPMDPEDADGFEDDDGCVDPDNDGDGLVDGSDACPDEAEDADGIDDTDGCPEPEVPMVVRVVDADGGEVDVARVTLTTADGERSFTGRFEGGLVPGAYAWAARSPGFETGQGELVVPDEGGEQVIELVAVPTKVVVTRDRIDLKDKIYFDTGKATIQKRSHGLLDDTVEVLKAYPEIVKLRIEGHTDSRGSADFNKDLSEQRAASVRAYFEAAGIDPERLSSVGYGEDRPLDPASTAEAYAKNRRVDFFVETWDAEAGAQTR